RRWRGRAAPGQTTHKSSNPGPETPPREALPPRRPAGHRRGAASSPRRGAPQPRAHFALFSTHASFLARRDLVIVSREGSDAMHQRPLLVIAERAAVLARLALSRFERDDDISERITHGGERSLAKRKGEHVSGAIDVPVSAVEVADLVVASERYAQLRAGE